MFTKEDVEKIKAKTVKIKHILDEIEAKTNESKKDFKNRALMVIETLVGGDIIWNDSLKDEIYEIAHVALGDCSNEHLDWREKTEKLFKSFEDGGFI